MLQALVNQHLLRMVLDVDLFPSISANIDVCLEFAKTKPRCAIHHPILPNVRQRFAMQQLESVEFKVSILEVVTTVTNVLLTMGVQKDFVLEHQKYALHQTINAHLFHAL